MKTMMMTSTSTSHRRLLSSSSSSQLSCWLWLSLLLCCGTVSAVSDSRLPYISKDSLRKQYGDQWTSYSEGSVEFLPANTNTINSNTNTINSMRRKLQDDEDRQYYNINDQDEDEDEDNKDIHADDDVYKAQPFVYGNDYYDEYQQAWRLLGFMIDCRSRDDGNNNNNNKNNRDLSGDEGTGEGCHRYVLWAAYVDLEYEGGGIGEYQFYDRDNKKWDDSSCAYDNNGSSNSRCAKMDCHLEDTHWSLLGFFKHYDLGDWMEQLFKHEGKCVWNDAQYSFMQTARETWPEDCIASGRYTTAATDENTGNGGGGGKMIYYDMKPISGGGIKLGLYTDTACVIEYKPIDKDDPITAENIVGNFLMDGDGGSGDNDNYDFSGMSLDEALDYWDNGLGAFRVCQPCIAYNLQNTGGGYYQDDDGNNNNNGDPFDCYDDADYTNVNQCMKFMAKTEMHTATFRDLSLARTQGTLSDNLFSGSTKKPRRGFYRREAFGTVLTYMFMLFSCYIFGKGCIGFARVKREVMNSETFAEFREPLAPIT